ncbi:MAG TPA: hypothetical protein PK307_09475 [Spirochaetota bacterium]|nr:hypothetical protein [Spirochaetota bacterium]HOD14154.1 hypothetical protein [Spirochaetota bacterium]HPG49199.1 hypothetical protein [Spirochaetota bacterium]HPN10749.1 hypothetical protein [Spirochaetota bacterium]HQL82419.1 hypothetical protein [Spirochaetota bacterium]
MSEKQYIYRCFTCSSTKEYREGENAPICCDMAMTRESLPQCTSASHPEMARNADNDEPCDDGRGKQ